MDEQAGFDARRAGVLESLEERSPEIAGLYRTALRTLERGPKINSEAAWISVISHCMRELMVNLPGIMADTAVTRPKPSAGSLVAQLPALISQHSDLDLGANQDIVPVPRAVARQIDLLIKTVTQEEGINKRNFAALVTGTSEIDHPAIKQWQDAYKVFMSGTHLDRRKNRSEGLTKGEVIAAMRVVEDVIEVRTSLFFSNLQSLKDLLTEINSTAD